MVTDGCSARFVFGGCRCKLDMAIWQNKSMGATIFPQSKLLICQGLLLRFNCLTHEIFGIHSLNALTHWKIRIVRPHSRLFFSFTITFPNTTITSSIFVHGVGLTCVRVLQRWWRSMRRRWQTLALMMALHPRLGKESPLAVLDSDLLRMCREHLN